LLIELIIGILSLVGILLGAELVVRSSQHIARRLKISEFYIGLTVLSIGTSLPEIFTHILGSINILNNPAQTQVLSNIVVGTNIGSNLIQITLITGLVGTFAIIRANREFLLRDYLVMLGSILLLFFFSLDGSIHRIEAGILVAVYIGYLIFLTREEKVIDKVEHNHKNIWSSILLAVLGLGILIFAAHYLLNAAVFFTDYFQISGSLIGVLVIGVGTALPELTTALVALFRKSSGLSIGTLVGSNITNPMLALGIGGLISGYTIGKEILWFDLPIWFLVSAIAFFLFWNKKFSLVRKEALILIGLYVAYVILRIKLFV